MSSSCSFVFEVETKRATPKEARDTPESCQSVTKVFVGGIPEEIEDSEIQSYFEQVTLLLLGCMALSTMGSGGGSSVGTNYGLDISKGIISLQNSGPIEIGMAIPTF